MHSLSQLRSGELSGIRQLSISENLTEFPLEILSLADTLEILDLSHNNLSSLPDEVAQLSKLKVIFASYNQFNHLPCVLGKLPNLEMIGFRANKIQYIAEESLPAKLRWLTLTENLLVTLPLSLGERPNLQKLMLAGNQLRELPQTLSHAHNLELVRLSANKLTSCPEQLLNLPKLAWFAFSGNPFSHVENTQEYNQIPEINSNSFTLGEVLGQGASGIIYKGRWKNKPPHLPADIAVKIFKAGITSDGYPQDELQSCLQAGKHPNIVSSLAQVNESNNKALIMSLIPAHYKNLGLPPTFQSCTRDTFANGFSLPISLVSKIVRQMSEVIQYLHTNLVCHGDIYAHNTLFDENRGDIIFGDFGAASRFQMLSDWQQQKIKQIEQRALTHFIEDLLNICHEADKKTIEYKQLAQLMTK